MLAAKTGDQWVALLSFSAAALKCSARDRWIGWDFRHQYNRLKLVTNNSRFLNNRLDYQLYYWRTNHGAEVDVLLCIGNRILFALEIKSSQNIAKENLAGLKSFMEDNPGVPAYVLGDKQNRRQLKDDITIINWDDFILGELQ